jgi:3-dehydroquinate synthase
VATTIEVKLGERAYPIHVGRGAPVGTVLDGAGPGQVLIVSDSNVDPLHGEECRRQLEARGLACLRVVVPAGEASKSLACLETLYARAADAGIDRSGVVVALGGGMVGDLAGFFAATYLRGIRFVQAPTTLLAMVDSSVGGKTGINLPQGKNLVGAFYQPVEVVADVDRLRTLPVREYLSGLAEVVKYGVIWDAVFFGQLEKQVDGLRARDPALLERVVVRCCEIKAEVVAMDERELGPRAILNFGHTLGHALEKVDGYGRWLHGEAVAIGLHYAARLSTAVEGFPKDQADRVVRLLRALGLPTWPAAGERPEWTALGRAMLSDKKTVRKKPRFVLARRLGEVVIGRGVEDQLLAETWNVCGQ